MVALALGLGLGMTGRGAASGGSPATYATGAVHLGGAAWLVNSSLTATDNSLASFSLWMRLTNWPPAFPDFNAPVLWVVDPAGTYTSYLALLGKDNGFGNVVGQAFLNYESVDSSTELLVYSNTNTLILPGGAWVHLAGCAKTNLPDGQRVSKIFLNGADVTDVIDDGGIFETVFNGLPFWIGSDNEAQDVLNGDLADVWIAPGQFVDFSDAPTLAKFRSGGKPVNLGSDGSTPTSVQPAIFLHATPGSEAATFVTNHGSGGAFTLTGTLTAASSSPSD